MEGLAILIVLGLIILVIVLPLVAMGQVSQLKRDVQSLGDRLRGLEGRAGERDGQLLQRESEQGGQHQPQGEGGAPGAKESLAMAPSTPETPPILPHVTSTAPPPLPPMLAARALTHEEVRAAVEALKTPRPAAIEAPPPAPPPPPVPPASNAPAFTLEQFMGVKLFAWVGGLALFLGIVFFVKLSIERGWISAERRTVIGFITGLALVAGGVWVNARKAYAVLGQTLCATGTVVLYGMTYVANAYYKFPMFSDHPWVAFALMTLFTTVAFLLAVRMEAQVVAVLGMVGGFLTPILCSTGEDHPLALFGYIALLDIGVLAVAKHRRWLYLTALAAAGTLILQGGWCDKFFVAEGYAYGPKTWVVVAVFLSFAALFTAAAWWTKRREEEDLYPAGAALATCGSAMFAAFYFLNFGGFAERLVLLYGFVFAINLCVMAVAWKEPRMSFAPVLIGLATFVHLAVWTTSRLTAELLPSALGAYLVFGLLHTSYGVLGQRRQRMLARIDAGWVPVSTLLLLLLPVLHLENVSLVVWPALLVVDLGIIGLALLSRSLMTVFAALVLTLITAMCWLFKLPPASHESLTMFLCVLGGFAIVFVIASCVLARRVTSSGERSAAQEDMARWLPVSSAVLPFALLVLAMLHLRVSNPSPVFGLALLLNLVLLGLGRFARITALPMAGLLCTLALGAVWHMQNFDPHIPWLPLAWYLGFHALFTLHPHIFRQHLAETTTPWAAAALAGAGTFVLVHPLVKQAWPNDCMGLVPLAFAVPQLLSLLAVLKLHRPENPARMTQIAWFGGMSLFFITLIFPIQFDRQWITISWALEGAALCWLFRRVPHSGLRATGAALLVVAFVRLALNPAVLAYQLRGDLPIWNWQLYAYSICAGAMFLAAWWLDPPRHLLAGINLRGLFTTFGGILLFLLLNIEIADAFTPSGSRSIAFDFSANLGRDMTYSIAWGLFALALLGIGFGMRSKHTRYAGIGLLAVTLLKLFFHDLAQLDSVYRIGALIVVAFTALAASFLYQRFDRSDEPAGKP